MRRPLALSLLVSGLAVGGAATAVAQQGSEASPVARYVLPGAAVFPEGIAREPTSSAFYVGSTTDGTIFRGTLRSSQPRVFAQPGAEGRTTAIGLKSDGRGNLVVAGGATGKVFVLSTRDGATRKVLDTGVRTGTFLNDVVISGGYAYVTDSMRPILYRVALAGGAWARWRRSPTSPRSTRRSTPTGSSPPPTAATSSSSSRGPGSSSGSRWPRGSCARSTWAGRTSSRRRAPAQQPTLYVARNRVELVVPVRLEPDFLSGVVGPGVTGPQLKFPTTLALDGKRLLAVNAQFDKRQTMMPELPFDVATIRAPKAPKAAGKGVGVRRP